MAALTYDHPLQYNNLSVRDTIAFVTKNGVQVYVGDLVELLGGYIQLHVAGSATCIVGIADRGGVPGSNPAMDGFNLATLPIPLIAPGNASTAAAGNANKVVVETGRVIARQVTLAVAGTLAGTIADVGAKLYCATSNIADASTTQPSTDKPLGKIVNFYSASGGNAVYDIEVMSYTDRLQA